MIKLLGIFGLCTLAVGSYVTAEGAGDGSMGPQAGQSAFVDESALFFSVAADAPRPVAAPGVSGRGLTCGAVSAELAAHLDLAPGVGLLVTRLQEGSPAAAAGLQRFDVLLDVDGEPADAELLDAALAGGKGLALRVVRGGVEHDLALAAEGQEPEGGLLSTETLGPEHPFRRLEQLESLRERTSEKAERLSQRASDLEAERRRAREEAKAAVEALQETGAAQISEYLAARETELFAILDGALTDELCAPLAGLAVGLDAVVPPASVEELDARLEALIEGWSEALAERATLGGGDETAEEARRARERFARLGQEASRRLSERVRRPWREGLESLDENRQRLGPKHAERAEWTTATVESIRAKVGERIHCAIERAGDDLARHLRERLRRRDLPAPGELEASLADVSEQLEELTWRFVRRTVSALELYETRLAVRAVDLTPALEAHLAVNRAALDELAAGFESALETHLAEPIELDGTWRGRALIDEAADGLRAELARVTDAGRDGLRHGAVGWVRDLEDERRVSEDAWSDLKSSLDSILRASGNDCWKLDGPHLDGRFPKAGAKPKGELSMAAR